MKIHSFSEEDGVDLVAGLDLFKANVFTSAYRAETVTCLSDLNEGQYITVLHCGRLGEGGEAGDTYSSHPKQVCLVSIL